PGGEVAGGTRGRRQALPDAAARPPGGGRGPDRHPGTPGADVPAPTGREGTETETEIDCHPGGGIMTANQIELRELHRGDAERCAELEREIGRASCRERGQSVVVAGEDTTAQTAGSTRMVG